MAVVSAGLLLDPEDNMEERSHLTDELRHVKAAYKRAEADLDNANTTIDKLCAEMIIADEHRASLLAENQDLSRQIKDLMREKQQLEDQVQKMRECKQANGKEAGSGPDAGKQVGGTVHCTPLGPDSACRTKGRGLRCLTSPGRAGGRERKNKKPRLAIEKVPGGVRDTEHPTHLDPDAILGPAAVKSGGPDMIQGGPNGSSPCPAAREGDTPPSRSGFQCEVMEVQQWASCDQDKWWGCSGGALSCRVNATLACARALIPLVFTTTLQQDSRHSERAEDELCTEAPQVVVGRARIDDVSKLHVCDKSGWGGSSCGGGTSDIPAFRAASSNLDAGSEAVWQDESYCNILTGVDTTLLQPSRASMMTTGRLEAIPTCSQCSSTPSQKDSDTSGLVGLGPEGASLLCRTQSAPLVRIPARRYSRGSLTAPCLICVDSGSSPVFLGSLRDSPLDVHAVATMDSCLPQSSTKQLRDQSRAKSEVEGALVDACEVAWRKEAVGKVASDKGRCPGVGTSVQETCKGLCEMVPVSDPSLGPAELRRPADIPPLHDVAEEDGASGQNPSSHVSPSEEIPVLGWVVTSPAAADSEPSDPAVSGDHESREQGRASHPSQDVVAGDLVPHALNWLSPPMEVRPPIGPAEIRRGVPGQDAAARWPCGPPCEVPAVNLNLRGGSGLRKVEVPAVTIVGFDAPSESGFTEVAMNPGL